MPDYTVSQDKVRANRNVEEELSPYVARKTASQILSTCGVGRILDVGCGNGALVRELLKHGVDAYGLDISETAIQYCNGLALNRFFKGSVLALPFEDGEFDTVVSTFLLEHFSAENVLRALHEIYRVSGRYVFLQISTSQDGHGIRPGTAEGREWWEQRCFEAGFRKHPFYYKINPYESLNREGNRISILLEKIPKQTLDKYPLTDLARERDLHMDMSREGGARSDAHMARYALAAEWVRPGDVVLDCACGYGYGTAVLAATSRGAKFLGVDVEESVVQYGVDHFTSAYGIEFKSGDAENLSFIQNSSIDVLVTFETLEHVPDFDAFLKEAKRVIKPDGRIVACVPNLWMDETGNDPNPYHFHVFDYQKLRAALLSHGFIVEARYNQMAPGGFKLWDSPRTMSRMPLEKTESEPDTEWCLLVASANPLEHRAASYSHPDFDQSVPNQSCHVVDFGRYYENPWLYRVMVQMGERVGDANELERLADKVLALYPASSADYGAALCVSGYSRLATQNMSLPQSKVLLGLVDDYVSLKSENPHTVRWQISAAYFGAMLSLRAGDRELAFHYFSRVLEVDPCIFSPLLSTKAISASFYSGVMNLGQEKIDEAKVCFRKGIDFARRALHYSDLNSIGDADNPFTFGFVELAEIADMASQCANALHYADMYTKSPGKFWGMVDIKRFGLVTWNLELQRTLDGLQAGLAKMYAEGGGQQATTQADGILSGLRILLSKIVAQLRKRMPQ